MIKRIQIFKKILMYPSKELHKPITKFKSVKTQFLQFCLAFRSKTSCPSIKTAIFLPIK